MADPVEIQKQMIAAIVELQRSQQEAQRTLQQCIDLLKQTSTDEWVQPSDFAVRSGMAVSDRQILERIRNGELKQATHWIDVSSGDRPTYLVCVRTLKTHFLKPPEKRRVRKAS